MLSYQWDPTGMTVECRLILQEDEYYQGSCKDPWGYLAPLLMAPARHNLSLDSFDIDVALSPWDVTPDILETSQSDVENAPNGIPINIGGRNLNMVEMGEGAVTVIFEAGMGDDLQVWRVVQANVAEFAHVVSYDRAGLGLSDAGPERSLEVVAEDLHSLLETTGISPPYVLVGHDIGGFFIRKYAAEYSDEVAGMVYVDAVHEQLKEFLRPLSPDSWDQFMQNRKTFYTMMPEPAKQEFDLYKNAIDAGRVEGLGALPDVPTFVLSGMRARDAARWIGEEPEGQQVVYDLHKAWADQLSDAKHLVAQRSLSYIHWEEPGLVVSAIRQLVEKIEGKR